MANPLYKAISGGSDGQENGAVNPTPSPSQTPSTPSNATQMTMQDALRQLQSNTAGMIKQAGYNVPEEYTHDPRSAAMYMIQSGQVGGPMMRRIQPMLNMLMGRR